MSIEELTQEEWDERREQLDKYLDGVEKRYIARLSAAMGFSREWVGLTDEEVGGLTVFDGLNHIEVPILADFARAIETKLKDKNT
jgi:hypothetical protein